VILLQMIRGDDVVAQAAVFGGGRCVVVWPTSVIVYDSFEAATAVHVEHMAGRGEKTRFDLVTAHPECERGAMTATQDRLEGMPFASIGGPDCRRLPQVRTGYANDPELWLLGYETACCQMYGSRWRDD
jgi:hypothetical protein